MIPLSSDMGKFTELDKSIERETDLALGLVVSNYFRLLKGLTTYMVFAAVLNIPLFYMYGSG